jgi:hypothetical protein
MNDIAHAFPAGHRLRLAISTGYWPIAWPAPEPVTLTLFTGESFLDLPIRLPDPRDAALRPFASPERAAAEATELRPSPLKRIIERDRTTNETSYTVSSGGGNLDAPELTRIKAIDLEVGHTMRKYFRIGEEDPGMAQVEIVQKTWFRRGAWRTRVETRTGFSSTPEDFVLDAEITAYEDNAPFFTRTWTRRIKRDLL